MDKRTTQLFALWCIEMMILFPVISAYAFSFTNSNVIVSGNEATIEWDTSSNTNYSLFYRVLGESVDNNIFVTDPSFKKNHSVTLPNLEQGSKYTYGLTAYDSDQDTPLMESRIGSFIVPDAYPPPQPTGVILEELLEGELTVAWDAFNSSEVSDLKHYMIYRNGENIANTSRTYYTDDEINASTNYVYQIAGYDNSGNIGPLSSGLIVTTLPPDETAPNLYNIQVIGASTSSVIVYWQTDENSDSAVYYGRASPTDFRQVSGSHINHTVTLSSLDEGETYQYIVSSCDASDNCRNSSQFSFVAGGDNTPPSLSVDVPETYNANVMPINGTTDALARIIIYLNGDPTPKRVVQADMTGDFSTDVYLDVSTSPNTLIVRAENVYGTYVEEEFSIMVDATLPVVSVSEMPVLSNSSSVSINGTVSEDVTLHMYIIGDDDNSIGTPSTPTGLENTSMSSSSVRLNWDANNNSEEIQFYNVYRNGVLRGTASSTSFSDCTNAMTAYSYQVAAVNENCDEGPFSDSVSLTTDEGSNCTSNNNLISDSCDGSTPTRSVNINEGSFKQSIPLTEGSNEITLKFEDDVGNSVYVYGSTIYDRKAPSITWTNVDEISPTYDDEVTIRGKVDEQATVTITVNNDSSYVGITDSNGNFSIDVDLERIDYDSTTSTSASSNQLTGNVVSDITNQNYYSYQHADEDLETTSLTWSANDGQFTNNLEIVAVDGVGRSSSIKEEELEYRLCSYGSWWGVTITDPQPSMLIPRHLLNGVSQISFNFELEWLGGSGSFDDETPRPTVSFNYRDIANDDEDDWDTDWFNRPRMYYQPDTNNTKGYVVIQSRAINSRVSNSNTYRRDLSNAVATNSTDNFTTTLAMEQNISAHRTNSSWDTKCLITAFGCVRLPVQLEITFTDPVYASVSDNIAGTTSYSSSGRTIQRQCLDMEIAIDQRVDVNVIPDWFLRDAIDFLNSTIEFIDNILEPLNDIKEYTLYACMGSWVVLYVKSLQKSYECEFKGTLKTLTGSGFKPAIAEMGLCEYFYGPNDEKENKNYKKTEACMGCTAKVKAYKDFEEVMQNICDRLACPSAPSFMEYVRQAQGDQGSQVTVTMRETLSNGSADPEGDSQNVVLNQRSDCYGLDVTFDMVDRQYAYWKEFLESSNGPQKIDNPPQSGVQRDPRTQSGQQAQTGVANSNDLVSGNQPTEKITCLDPHAPNNDCCVIEYMRKYDSVCGLSLGLGRGVLFDEMKESYCVAGSLSETNKSRTTTPVVGGTPTTPSSSNPDSAGLIGEEFTSADYGKECNTPGRRLWAGLSGICDSSEQQAAQIIKADVYYRTDATDVWIDKTATQPTQDTEKRQNTAITIYDKEEGSTSGGAPKNNVASYNGECPVTLRAHDEKNIFYRVTPDENNNEDNQNYIIHRGMVLRNIDIANSVVSLVTSGSTSSASGDTPVGQSLIFRPLGGPLPADWFKQQRGETIDRGATVGDVTSTDGFEAFKIDMEKCASKTEYTQTRSAELTDLSNNLFAAISGQQGKSIADAKTEIMKSPAMKNSGMNPNQLDEILNASTVQSGGIIKPSTNLTNNKATITSMSRTQIKTGLESTLTLNNNVVRATYQKIQSAMGLGDKVEIVDPTSSFLRSVQCLCLPGVTGYLKLWRAIMVAVKACLNTILITGDGNPGICRAVLTQYVCDLIYDLIRCFATKYNTGFDREYGVEGFPGNILGTLTSAGRDVERSIAGRYGDSSFFRAMFAERQLVHALCLWAFTGTFDFDFNTLVDGEFGDVPVDSQGLISPCQRRYISYNSAAGGKTTWNYYFGVGLVAGADLTYRLYLQCSDGYDCDYGYGDEQCDCSSAGVQTRGVSLSGASTSMSRYDVLEEEFDETITSNYRYDKVILSYTYTDKDRDRVTSNVSCNLRTVGGQPPGFCQFDVGQGIYRCSVDVGQDDFVQLIRVNDPKENHPYWRNGDVLRINAEVSQQLPDSLTCTSATSCSSTKYLTIELNDHKGDPLIDPEEPGSYRPLLVDGTLTYSVPASPYTITTQALMGTGSSSLACTIPTGFESSFIGSCSGDFASSADSLTLTYETTGHTITATDSSGSTITPTTGDCKFTAASSTNICSFLVNGKAILVNVRKAFTSSDGTTGTASAGSITLKPTVQNAVASGSSSDLCGGEDEVVWTGKVKIMDSQDEGGVYGMSNNVYEYQGQKQEQSFSIRVNCKDDPTGATGTTVSFLTIIDPSKITLNGEGIGSNPSISKGNNVEFKLEANEDLNSAYYKITKPNNQFEKSENLIQDGSYLKWKSSTPWVPQVSGDYQIEIVVRPITAGSSSYGRVFTVDVAE